MQTTSASGAWQYLISARETQTKRDLCQMVWLQGSQCREFKVFVAQPCIFSCCGSRERQICASSCILVTLSGSSRATEAPARVDAFQVLWGGGPVCLCVFVPLLSGCLWNRLPFPLHMSLWLRARLRGRASRGFLVPFPGSSDSKRHSLQQEIVRQRGKEWGRAEKGLICRK